LADHRSHHFIWKIRPVPRVVGIPNAIPMTLRPLCLALVLAASAGAEVDFAHQIVPILRKHCAECHMEGASKGGLSMNTRESLLAGSEDGSIVEPGKADESLLLEALLSDDKVDRMPPKGARVPPDQIELIRQWINEGLNWEPGFTFGEDAYEPPLKPRRPELPPATAGRDHPVDRIVDHHLASGEIPHPADLDDAAFLRRAALDLTGLLPSPEDIISFTADTAPDKRAKKIAALLADDTAYADHWISFWNDLLRNDYQGTGYIDGGRTQITGWLYQALRDNLPYDQFARDLLAPPTPQSAGFINGIQWRGAVNASQTREIQFSQSISQTFLGLNMKCASCHDSFVDRWKLDEAYSLAAIFAEKPLEIARCDVPTGRFAKPAWIFPELGEIDPAAPKPERLKQLAALMTHPENGRFTRTIVNRLWQRLMGRGIVHPVDAMDTAPWNEDLLDHLATQFTDDGYDLRKALAHIATSAIYQSAPIITEDPTKAEFRGPVSKRLTAEQFVDAVWTLTGTSPAKAHPAVAAVRTTRSTPLQAKWIWSYPTASANSPAGEKIVLGTEIELAEAPTSARAVFIADNAGILYLNGIEIARTEGDPVARETLLTGLKPGRNHLLVVATNGGDAPNPAGFIFEAHLTFPTAETRVITSDASWKWSATLPNADGRFQRPPGDWKPAAELENPAVWASFAAGLAPGPATAGSPSTAIRAALVPADMLMRALGRPNREQIVSMRPDTLTTLEAIDLANGNQLAGLLKSGAQTLATTRPDAPSLIENLFLRALSRPPTPAEKSALVGAIGQNPSTQSIEDLLWMLILLPEFQFVR
jgi:hypothetical protein